MSDHDTFKEIMTVNPRCSDENREKSIEVHVLCDSIKISNM